MATTNTNITDIPPGIATPDRVESRLGTLNFTDGVPDDVTAQKLFDELDYVHAVSAFINGYAAVNQLALLKGFNADGSTTVYFGPTQPDGVKRGNWVQTLPGKGWFTIIRLYSPLQPFFDKSWRPSEIELVK